MLTKEMIVERAHEYGAALVGVGDIARWQGTIPERDPKSILPKAKCVIGFGFGIPAGLYAAMKQGRHKLNFTNFGVRYIDETLTDIMLLKMAHTIEDAGYDACIQRRISNLRIKGDEVINPEVASSYELIHTVPVAEGKPAPEIIMDFEEAAVYCGLGTRSRRGGVLTPAFGPFVRFVFIVTDAPLEPDPVLAGSLCDGCGLCEKACPAGAIGKTFDHARCFDGYSAKGSAPIDGYRVCDCLRACDIACYEHLKGVTL